MGDAGAASDAYREVCRLDSRAKKLFFAKDMWIEDLRVRYVSKD